MHAWEPESDQRLWVALPVKLSEQLTFEQKPAWNEGVRNETVYHESALSNKKGKSKERVGA